MFARAMIASYLLSLSFGPLLGQSRFERLYLDDNFAAELADGESNEKQLAIQIGIDHDLVTVEGKPSFYRQKFGRASSTNCQSEAGFSAWIGTDTALSLDLSAYAVGTQVRLCLEGWAGKEKTKGRPKFATKSIDWRIGVPNPSIYIVNPDPYFADIELIDALPADISDIEWLVLDTDELSVLSSFPAEIMRFDFYRAADFSGKRLKVSLKHKGKTYLSKNSLEIPKPQIKSSGAETLTSVQGVNLLGQPIIQRFNFSFAQYVPGCTKTCKVNIFGTGLICEETCDYRTYPSEFTSSQVAVLSQVARSTFHTMMQKSLRDPANPRSEKFYTVSDCASGRANFSHSPLNVKRGLTYPQDALTHEKIVEYQLARWSPFGRFQMEDFNLHVLIYNVAPNKAAANADIGLVLEDYAHRKPNFPNTFQVRVNPFFIPQTVGVPERKPFTSSQDKDGDGKPDVLNYLVSSEILAGFIAHEMLHQMGMGHTKDGTNGDFDDDFVYSYGDCVEDNHVPNYEWRNAVGF